MMRGLVSLLFWGGLLLVALISLLSCRSCQEGDQYPNHPIAPVVGVQTPSGSSGDDNGDGRVDEDESGWDCLRMGNLICGPGVAP